MSSTSGASPSAPNPQTQQLLLDYAIKEIESQGKNFEYFDRKTGFVLGFALVSIAQMVTVLLRLTAEDFVLRTSHPHIMLTLVFAGLAFVIAAVVCGLLGLFPRTFYEFTMLPEIKSLSKNLANNSCRINKPVLPSFWVRSSLP